MSIDILGWSFVEAAHDLQQQPAPSAESRQHKGFILGQEAIELAIIVDSSSVSLQWYLVGNNPFWSDHFLVIEVTLMQSMDFSVGSVRS